MVFFQRTKRIIEFELKDFSKVFNQEIEVIQSTKYKYGDYDWYLKSCVKKYKHQADGDLWLIIYLHGKSDEQIDFPFLANVNFSILNKDKDSRKDFSKCNSYCFI